MTPDVMYRIGFLGPTGSFTQKAAKAISSVLSKNSPSPSTPTNHKLIPLTTIPECYRCVQINVADLGVAPIENSTNGPVILTWDILTHQFLQGGGQHNPSAGIKIVGEVDVRVKFCLLGRKSNSTTEVGLAIDNENKDSVSDLSHIKLITTHPQSWTQCSRFLSKLPNVQRQDAPSTSEAACIAAADHSGTTAAISSRSAAQEAGLEVLRSDIHDRSDNGTRFWVVASEEKGAAMSILLEKGTEKGNNFKKALIAFQPGTYPQSDKTCANGSLSKVLRVLDSLDSIVLLRLFSRPSREISWDLVYYAEVEINVTGRSGLSAYTWAASEISALEKELLEAGCAKAGCMGIWSADPLVADDC